jgi:DNA-binding PadR family transcriptional regulator
MESWRMDVWADIRYGSIYQVLDRMAREGLVEEVSRSREGRRPARSTYAITQAGREELRRLLRRAWSTPSQEVQPVNVALSFIGFGLLPDSDVDACLEQRLKGLEAAAADLREQEKATIGPVSDPGLIRCLTDHFDHFHRIVEAERAWAAQVLAHLRDGSYAMAASPEPPMEPATRPGHAGGHGA